MRALIVVFAFAGCGGSPTIAKPGPTPPAPAPVARRPEVAPTPPAPPIAHAIGHPSGAITPRRSIFQPVVNTMARLSPDGKRLAWLAPRNNVPLPWLAPIDDVKAATSIVSDTTRPVTAVFWTADGSALLYVQDPEGNGNAHVFRYNLADGKTSDLVPVKGARVDLLGLGPRHPELVIVGINDRDPKFDDIYSVDLKTGDRKRVVVNTDELTGFIIDYDLKVRIGIRALPDGSSVLLANGAKGFTVWDSVPAADRVTVLGFDPKGTTVFTVDNRGRDTSAVFAVDVATKKKTLLAEDARVDSSSAFINPTSFQMGAISFGYLRATWKVVDRTIAADVAAIDALADGTWELTSASKDGRQWLLAVSSDIRPTRYFLYDRKTKQGRVVMTMTPALEPLVPTLSRMVPSVVHARDGVDIVAFATIPREHDLDSDGVPDHPLPTVLLVGADPTFAEAWGFDPLHQWLASRGYVVLSVNVRGTTGYGRAFVAAGAHQWGKQLEDDLLDTVAWAVDHKLADPKRVAIAGLVYGGYAALLALERAPDVFACAIDILGPTDLTTYARLMAPAYIPAFQLRIGDPTTAAGLEGLRAISPITHADAITKPLLVVHSAEPNTAADVAKLVDVARHHARVSYVMFSDEPAPNIARAENNVAMLGIFEAFLSEHLGGPFEPLAPEALAASSLKVVSGGEGIPGLP